MSTIEERIQFELGRLRVQNLMLEMQVEQLQAQLAAAAAPAPKTDG